MRVLYVSLVLVGLAWGCGEGESSGGADAPASEEVVDAVDANAADETDGASAPIPDVAGDEESASPEVSPDGSVGDSADGIELPEFEEVGFPPRKLAFAFERPARGEPVDAQEVSAFTERIAGTMQEVGYFRWLLRTSTGVDASTGKADYLAWHNDVHAVKQGGQVTFKQMGHEHNMWIPSAKVLSGAMGAYLHTGDWQAAKLTEQYCKGLTAVVRGFVWGEDDPAPYLMARAVFPQDHEFALDAERWGDDGRGKRVEFSHAWTEAEHWNAATFPWPENPTWGSIWVTNKRSKDDVRAISRLTPFLHYVVEDAPDEWVKAACAETLETMIGFHKDIVDEEYFIRTKDKQGQAYRLPCSDNSDLGSYVCYASVDPGNECCARLATDMIAYGERRTNDCGTCTGSLYDKIAPVGNIYNVSIIWDYHMAGVVASLLHRQHEDAFHALRGLADRIDGYVHPDPDDTVAQAPTWSSHVAHLLVEAAAVGLPLTAEEARMVQRFWDQTAQELKAWPNWDLWDQSVPDGTYGGWTNWDWWVSGQPPAEQGLTQFRPVTSTDAIPVQWFATLFEYCASPFKNPAGEAFVDCDLLSTYASNPVE
jgi:hypothetical protein